MKRNEEEKEERRRRAPGHPRGARGLVAMDRILFIVLLREEAKKEEKEEEKTSLQLFTSSLGCPAKDIYAATQRPLPLPALYALGNLDFLRATGIWHPLVRCLSRRRSTGKFGVFWEMPTRNYFLRSLVSGSHLCGVFYDPLYLKVTCSEFARGVQNYGLFWKMTSGWIPCPARVGSTLDTCLRQFTTAFTVHTAENCGNSAVAVLQGRRHFLHGVQRQISMVLLFSRP